MKINPSLIAVPVLFFTTACSTHYSVSGHSHRHHRSHVSVGVHGHSHGSAGNVLGALIIGGLIGHALTEASHEKEEEKRLGRIRESSADSLENGYSIKQSETSHEVKPEKNSEQNRFYQLGQDGKCYLMEKKGESVEIVSAVPPFSCQ